MRFAAILFVFLVSVSFAIATEAISAEKGDLKKLQGDWKAKVPTEDGEQDATMTIKGNKLRFETENGQEWYEGTFEIDTDAKPKRMSILIEDCPIDQFKKKTVEAIYALEKKSFTVCATAPGSPEGPSGFDDEKARTIEFKKE